ncbi:MAG: hypothetical protein Harvfovirus3_61 [Harvfovirus sp.]|uniref:Uncharacterized protein n=1 Tax=Harvfovirus sp. TaxID=2487768 RepID=A0A3G5A062_9VIRU|nr:MAG: hypothetical protein Harvfovirus3_61 [Harvfovirus sp.]
MIDPIIAIVLSYVETFELIQCNSLSSRFARQCFTLLKLIERSPFALPPHKIAQHDLSKFVDF